MVVGEEFLEVAVSLGGGAVGVEFHGFEVTVERHTHIAVLAIGVATQVVGVGERLFGYTCAFNDFVGGIEGGFSLAAREHIFDFLNGFHLVTCFIGQNYTNFTNYHYLCQ